MPLSRYEIMWVLKLTEYIVVEKRETGRARERKSPRTQGEAF